MNHASAQTCSRNIALSRHPSRARRGFTLLEVTLAALIGSLVVMGCVALFSTIGKSQQRHEIRVAQTNDFARAYRIIERSMQLLVMADDGATNDSDANERIERDIQRTDGLMLDDDGEDLNTARMALTYDRSASGSLVYENRSVPPQVLRLALRAPPVAGGFQGTQSIADPTQFTDRALAVQAQQRERERRLAQRLTNSTSGTGGGSWRRAGSNGNTAGADAASALAAANAAANTESENANGNNSGDDENAEDNTNAEGENVDEDSLDVEHPRTPGVRAEFVLLPDGDSLTSSLTNTTATGDVFAGRIADGSNAESGWSLWYRELPPRNSAEGLTEEERERALSGDTSGIDMDIDTADLSLNVDPSSLRTIRLISGLRTCQWSIFRKQRLDTQIVALAARELPSYVELSLETIDGRRENWMFEVGWSVGEEPGRPIALGADEINAPPVINGDPSLVGGDENGGGGNGPGRGDGNGTIGGGGNGNGGKPNANPSPDRTNHNPKRGNPRNIRTNTGNSGNGGRIGNTSPK